MASPAGTLIVRPNVSLTDDLGNTWFFRDGQVYRNGEVDALTNRVVAIGFIDGKVMQQNTDNLWWQKTYEGYDGWGTPGNPDGHIANPFPQSERTIVTQGSAAPIVDRAGNLWWVDNGKVVENGVPDNLTAGVLSVAMDWSGAIYQQNNHHLWWQKTYQGWGGWGTPGTPDGHITFDPTQFLSPLWIGGSSNNDAADPANWSLVDSLPAPGTIAHISGGVINVHGDVLDDVTIDEAMSSSPKQDSATVNISGESHLSVNTAFQNSGSMTVNLAENSQWVGGFDSLYGEITVQGDGKFANTLSLMGNQTAVINSDVVGNGLFSIGASYPRHAKLEFMRSVSAGQSVTMDTARSFTQGIGSFIVLQVDNPQAFEASVKLGFGEVILKSLQADHYSFKNDLLSMYQGGQVVDTVPLRLIPDNTTGGGGGAVNFGVSQIAGDIVLHATNNTYGGILLPQLG